MGEWYNGHREVNMSTDTKILCSRCLSSLPATKEFFDVQATRPRGFCSWCKQCRRKARSKAVDPAAQLRRNETGRAWHQKLRRDVLTHYSGGGPFCACCGESHYEFLSLDHINGGGGKERKSLKVTSNKPIYARLRNEGYPEGFRVLCMNCNHARGSWGYCPHQKTTPSAT
jgi:hypothetical protein